MFSNVLICDQKVSNTRNQCHQQKDTQNKTLVMFTNAKLKKYDKAFIYKINPVSALKISGHTILSVKKPIKPSPDISIYVWLLIHMLLNAQTARKTAFTCYTIQH
jgi:hypothetical protein